jgi:hypothetical protein
MLKNKKVLLNFIILYFFSTLWSSPGWCAGPIDDLLYPPYPLTEKDRATLGVVGITRGLYLPEAVFDTFAKGKGSGTEKGAAEGFLAAIGNMGPCSGAFCGVAALLWIATAGTVGAVYGGIKGHKDALPAEEVQKIEQSIEELYTDLKLQNRISEKLLQTAHKKTTKKLVSINSYGPTATGEKVDYSVLKSIPIDSVLEISVVNFGFKTWPRELKPPNNTVIDDKDPLLSLFLNVGPRLIRLYDNKVLYQPRLEISSKLLKRSEWMANHTHAFFDEIESLLDASVDKISDDVFITFYLPGENESIFK